MYNERIIIDTRKYYVDEIFERYKLDRIIFCQKSRIPVSRKRKITKEVIGALSRGIPFPPVYVSELQTGELLVLDKSDRLGLLMEFLEKEWKTESDYLDIYENEYLPADFLKNIIYSPIILHVIDYINPKYVHMQVGAFIEDWSITQEQSVRNILYEGEEIEKLNSILYKIGYSNKGNLHEQYNLVYFIMVNLIGMEIFEYDECIDNDKFQLLEKAIYELKYMNNKYSDDIGHCFEYVFSLMRDNYYGHRILLNAPPENKTKYLCFLNEWLIIRGRDNVYNFFEDKIIRNMIENCDMSYKGIIKILDYFKRGY